jgi:hypothetical protein
MAWEGLLSPLYNVLKDLARWAYGRFKPRDSAEVLRQRTKWKAEFERNTSLLDNRDVIIRDLNRMDSYPNINEREKGISAWFKTEFKGLYHRGFEVFLCVESARYLEAENGWAFCRYDAEGAENVFLVGRIPYDVVREVDWSGDEYYPTPHVYCDFNRRLGKEPYEEIVLCRRYEGSQGDWFTDLAEYAVVRKLTKKLGGPDV